MFVYHVTDCASLRYVPLALGKHQLSIYPVLYMVAEEQVLHRSAHPHIQHEAFAGATTWSQGKAHDKHVSKTPVRWSHQWGRTAWSTGGPHRRRRLGDLNSFFYQIKLVLASLSREYLEYKTPLSISILRNLSCV